MCDGFLFKVSKCLWTLDETVLVIDMKQAEKIYGELSCCDNYNSCDNSPSELGTCIEKCDLLLNVTVRPCTECKSLELCFVFNEGITNAKKFGGNGYYLIFTSQPLHNLMM